MVVFYLEDFDVRVCCNVTFCVGHTREPHVIVSYSHLTFDVQVSPSSSGGTIFYLGERNVLYRHKRDMGSVVPTNPLFPYCLLYTCFLVCMCDFVLYDSK